MAKPSVIEARKARAMQEHAEGLTEVNRKLDMILEYLGLKEVVMTEEEFKASQAVEPDSGVEALSKVAEALAAESEVLDPAQGFVEPEPEAEPEPEVKPKDKSKDKSKK